MKKILIGLCLAISTLSFSQSGFEGLIVEKFYEVTAADVAVAQAQLENFTGDPTAVTTLKAGMKTYRIYVDLATGYKLQFVYGQTVIGVKQHKLRFESKTGNFCLDKTKPDGDFFKLNAFFQDNEFSFASAGLNK